MYHACSSGPGQESQKPISQEQGHELGLCISGKLSLYKEE